MDGGREGGTDGWREGRRERREEGREEEDHQQPAVGIAVPGNEDSMYRELDGRYLLC